jgi:hypothetical protein
VIRWLAPLAFLALVACQPESVGVGSGAPEAPEQLDACDIDPKLEPSALAAIALWSEAAGAPIPLPIRIELADFGDDRDHGAAWSAELDVIQVSSLTPAEERAATIAHELGHSLGLEHEVGSGSLMDPDRPTSARLRPCITAELAAGAGYAGPGACAPLAP